eukprot:SAG31_NODE_2250_length_6083_cov_3.636531_4_plen_89_part_00
MSICFGFDLIATYTGVCVWHTYWRSSIAELETSTQEVLDKLMKEDLDDSSRSHGMPSEDITDFHEPSPTASAQATTQREQLKTEDLRI